MQPTTGNPEALRNSADTPLHADAKSHSAINAVNVASTRAAE